MQNEKQMNFVSTPLSLPLFMVSRNRLKRNSLDRVTEHISKSAARYTRSCNKENAKDTKSFQYFRHITGLEAAPKFPYPQKKPLKFERSMGVTHLWQQAPNRYGVLKEPFEQQALSKGAAFAKLPTHKSLATRKKDAWHFYSVGGGTERLFSKENAQKGVFLSNARDRRGTSRHMVANPLTCYRNPNDPGPADTHSYYYELAHNAIPARITPPDNPHLFGRYSCVPSKPSALVKRHISFMPGPGRYETFYRNTCPCGSRCVYMPGLQQFIDEQKRRKFRRLPYQRIQKRLYCSPDWQHVTGHGHKWLFKKKSEATTKLKTPQESKKSDKQLKLYADGKYLHMINNPVRNAISLRSDVVPDYVPKIKFNCIAKRIMRKQLRNNKKIAFNSGSERWKDADRPIQLTARQIEALKMRLPEDRRLMDRPLMLPRKSQIKSRILDIPDRMLPTVATKLRKRLFKFQPLPVAKVLVTDSDIRPQITYDEQNPTGFYRLPFNEQDFFRKSAIDRAIRQPTRDLPPGSARTSVVKSENVRMSLMDKLL